MLIIFIKQPKPLQKSATDFYVGGDLSSIIEVEENGGVFYDYEGKEKDVFKILKENGMDSIRIRVWNDPLDENGIPYANGHNDLETAVQIGKRATACDMRVLIDFHYSDYWADPSSQEVPKDWKNLTFSEKEKALYEYTKTSLCKLLDAGVNVTMVQIGNETTSGLAGETDWDKITSLMSAGSKAVRETAEKYNREILVAMHFTEYKHYDWYASQLQQYEVDYDVFASSYYPYWHGDLAGLEKALQNIIDKYQKKVLIVEFAYPYNLANTDNHPNAISWGSSFTFPYTVNRNGQAEAICDIYKTATALGDDCLGLFYWEPTWISIPDSDYVGSPWENQALFDSNGKPLPALRSFLFSENH
jgi:arabinogalactan endo-1,4-beta-galactosidase